MKLSFQTIFDAFTMINSIMMPTGNLGISRAQMPQIDGPHQSEFVKWLAAQGVKSKRMKTPASGLMLAQNEINKAKVFKLMQVYREGNLAKWAPVIISKDGFVVDGSHRFVAIYNINRWMDIDVIKVDMNAVALVQLCQRFAKVKYRNHSDGKVSA